MLFATVPAAPPTRTNQRTTSCPAPISAKVPYQRGSILILSALEWVSIGASFTACVVLNASTNETREFLFPDDPALKNYTLSLVRNRQVGGNNFHVPIIVNAPAGARGSFSSNSAASGRMCSSRFVRARISSTEIRNFVKSCWLA